MPVTIEQKCESPIEELLAERLAADLDERVLCQMQRMAVAPGKRYRVDFKLTIGASVVAIETDGKDFHDFAADRKRDIDLIDHCGFTDVVRLRGCDVCFELDNCIWFLRQTVPALFGLTDEHRTAEELTFLARGMDSRQDSPIYRGRICGSDRVMTGMGGLRLLKRATHGRDVIGEVMRTTWDRVYRGQPIWSLAEYLEKRGISLFDWINGD